MKKDDEVLIEFEKEADALVIRDYIEKNTKDFNESKVYIIYDRSIIEEYDENIFKMKKEFKHFKTFVISKPIQII